jgi:myosin heavy subunit
VEEAMLSVGMQKEDRGAIGRILEGILCLGNIQFEHMTE